METDKRLEPDSMALDPGHHHEVHHHSTGVRWLDVIAGVSAIFISVVSLVVSIQHGESMDKMVKQNERMVAASTLPFLTLAGNQYDPATNKRREQLVLSNDGVGPAVIDWFEMRYKGVAYGTLDELLRACCSVGLTAAERSSGVFYANISGTVLPAREHTAPIDIEPRASLALMNAVERARNDFDFHACYCSVLEECWITDFNPGRPKRVPDCKVPKGVHPF